MTEYVMIKQPEPLTRSLASLNSEVQEHLINDTIAVRTPQGTYLDTPANFAKDYGQPFPPIPAGAVEVTYVFGVRHTLTDVGNNVIGGGPLPWDLGDEIIAALPMLLEKQTARRLEEEKNKPPIPVPEGSGG